RSGRTGVGPGSTVDAPEVVVVVVGDDASGRGLGADAGEGIQVGGGKAQVPAEHDLVDHVPLLAHPIGQRRIACRADGVGHGHVGRVGAEPPVIADADRVGVVIVEWVVVGAAGVGVDRARAVGGVVRDPGGVVAD